MITNCLDTQHNVWDDNHSSQATAGTVPAIWQDTYASQWPSAQNCHRLSDLTQGDATRVRGEGWNKVTPWPQTDEPAGGTYQ